VHLRQPASLSDSSARATGGARTPSRSSAQECRDDAPRALGPALGAPYVAVVVTYASAHLESLLATRALIFIYWHGCVHPPLNQVLLLLPVFRSVQLESDISAQRDLISSATFPSEYSTTGKPWTSASVTTLSKGIFDTTSAPSLAQ
jgi:hypothetical protein